METVETEKRQGKTLSEEDLNRINFVTFMHVYFASAYKMNKQAAYFYLKKYGGWNYLTENWWALHIDNPDHVVEELFEICHRNGGLR
ncbi:MAG: DUF3791 domain-containing protein [Prevotellaceae bacterium]|jgi:hypothetical protein|nr:DUF3791 domain-containing protein [Prevotellaceae bacterium]